jgi:hypothetical protein
VYSINGYLIALRSRSTHTVCVEGKDDRLVVKHCLLKFIGDDEHLNTRYVVDSMDIIESDGTAHGNSDKMRKICALLVDSPYRGNMTALADREYQWFDISNREIDLSTAHRNLYDLLFFTRGHSVENYFFEPEYFIQYIEFNHATSLTANHRQLIASNWEHILELAASLTFAIHENNCCTKTKGLFSLSHWHEVGGGRLDIDGSEIKTSLLLREIPTKTADEILRNTFSHREIFRNRTIVSRWITHGHIGLDLLCGAIGRIMAICGVDLATCKAVNGFSDIKRKHFASQWFDRARDKDDLFPIAFFDRILSAIDRP